MNEFYICWNQGMATYHLFFHVSPVVKRQNLYPCPAQDPEISVGISTYWFLSSIVYNIHVQKLFFQKLHFCPKFLESLTLWHVFTHMSIDYETSFQKIYSLVGIYSKLWILELIENIFPSGVSNHLKCFWLLNKNVVHHINDRQSGLQDPSAYA